MAASKPITAECTGYHWPGSRGFQLKATVSDGPAALVGKRLSVSLTFEQVADLFSQAEACEEQIGESQKRIDAINRGNQAE